MPNDNFQQTVDLRGKMERSKPASSAGRKAVAPREATSPLEKIYRDEEAVKPKADLKIFRAPKAKEPREGLIRLIVFILAILVVGATVYFLFFRTKGAVVDIKAQNWYAVKLVDGEIFYGQIFDVASDPVAMANVYYNYDQAKEKDGASPAPETGNLRLVKRGQETHGPAGTMDIVRTQVLFMEPLKADSKVLKAILEYEK